jgi:hypothetical protein
MESSVPSKKTREVGKSSLLSQTNDEDYFTKIWYFAVFLYHFTKVVAFYLILDHFIAYTILAQ